jgi:hypothetical protein
MESTDGRMERNGQGRRREGRRGRAGGGGERNATVEHVAKGLGWFSVGLGAAQIVAPRAVAKIVGVRANGRTLATMRGVGLREIAAGIGILFRTRTVRWLWGRVAGDVIDIGLLANALTSGKARRTKALLATAAVGGITLVDTLAAKQFSVDTSDADREARRLKHTRSITVKRAPDEVARLWRAWDTGEGGEASARFVAAPGGRGTEIHVEHAALEGPKVMARLRRFKQTVETGEIVHSDASVHKGPHPAQPSGLGRAEVAR